MKQNILGMEVETISHEDTKDLTSLTVKLQSSIFSMKNNSMCITEDTSDETKLLLTREVNKHYESYLKILEEIKEKVNEIHLEQVNA